MPKEIDLDFEKDTNQRSNEKSAAKRGKQRGKGKRIKKTFLMINQGPQKSGKMTQEDKQSHPGIVIAQKIKDLHKKPQTNTLPIKNVLKQISQLYEERVRMVRERRLAPDQEMQIFAFNKFMNNYGFKNVAEQKYIQFLLSVQNYLQINRVNFFARLMQLHTTDKFNYSNEETEKYFQAYEFIVKVSQLGSLIHNNDTDMKFIVPYLKVLDYIKTCLEQLLSADDIQEVRNWVEANKEPDKNYQYNNQAILDFDQLMQKVLEKYRLMLLRTQDFVIHAFQAADLDWNQKINLNEFMTLYRHIEHSKFNFKRTLKLFEENADIITNQEKNLSFNKFTALSLDKGIFTEDAQNKYLSISNEDIETKFAEVKGGWDEEKFVILKQIDQLKGFVLDESYKKWKEILFQLEERLLGKQLNSQMKPTLIGYKILKDELQRIIEEGKKQHAEEGQEENNLEKNLENSSESDGAPEPDNQSDSPDELDKINNEGEDAAENMDRSNLADYTYLDFDEGSKTKIQEQDDEENEDDLLKLTLEPKGSAPPK